MDQAAWGQPARYQGHRKDTINYYRSSKSFQFAAVVGESVSVKYLLSQ